MEEFMIKVILVELELDHTMYDLKYSDCHEILGAIGRTQVQVLGGIGRTQD